MIFMQFYESGRLRESTDGSRQRGRQLCKLFLKATFNFTAHESSSNKIIARIMFTAITQLLSLTQMMDDTQKNSFDCCDENILPEWCVLC